MFINFKMVLINNDPLDNNLQNMQKRIQTFTKQICSTICQKALLPYFKYLLHTCFYFG